MSHDESCLVVVQIQTQLYVHDIPQHEGSVYNFLQPNYTGWFHHGSSPEILDKPKFGSATWPRS